MAGDAFYTAILVGLGLDELSMNAVSIPLIKHVIRSIRADDCRTACTAGKRRPTSVPMIAITTSNSTSVKPRRCRKEDVTA